MPSRHSRRLFRDGGLHIQIRSNNDLVHPTQSIMSSSHRRNSNHDKKEIGNSAEDDTGIYSAAFLPAARGSECGENGGNDHRSAEACSV